MLYFGQRVAPILPVLLPAAKLLSPGAQAIRVLRVLCREEFGIASAKTFVEDVQRSLEWLTSHYIYTPEQVHPLMAGLTWRATCQCPPSAYGMLKEASHVFVSC